MKKRTAKIIDIFLTIGIIICLSFTGALLYRNVCYDEILVSGHSMESSLHSGDFGLMKTTKSALNNIKRFDIVIVEVDSETSNSRDIIKRVIGLPGETIKIETSGEIKINNTALDEPFLTCDKVLSYRSSASFACLDEYKIPENSFFCLGDNRGASADSRSRGAFERKDIVGVLKVIYKENCSENGKACKSIQPRWF